MIKPPDVFMLKVRPGQKSDLFREKIRPLENKYIWSGDCNLLTLGLSGLIGEVTSGRIFIWVLKSCSEYCQQTEVVRTFQTVYPWRSIWPLPEEYMVTVGTQN